MSPKRRITKHMMKQDRLVTTTFQLTQFVQNNLNQILMVAGGVLIVALVAIFFLSSAPRRAKEADQLLGKASFELRMGNSQQAILDLNSVISRYAGTKAASQATFFLANAFFYSRNYDQAQQTFQRYVDKYKKDPLFLGAAYDGIAQCHLENKEYSQAGEFFLKAYQSDPSGFLSPGYLLSGANAFKYGNDLEKAKQTYQKLIDQFPESAEWNQAKRELAEMTYGYISK
jgi:TolA-binding protein